MGYALNYSDKPDLHNFSERETFTDDGAVTDKQQSRGTSGMENIGHNISLWGSTKVLVNSLLVGFSTAFGQSNNHSLIEMTRTDGADALVGEQTTKGGGWSKTKPRLNADAKYSHKLPWDYKAEYQYTYADNLSKSFSSSRIDFADNKPFQERLSENSSGVNEHAVKIHIRRYTGRTVKTHRVFAFMTYTHRNYNNTSEYMRWDASE